MENYILKETLLKPNKISLYYTGEDIQDIDILIYNISRRSVDFIKSLRDIWISVNKKYMFPNPFFLSDYFYIDEEVNGVFNDGVITSIVKFNKGNIGFKNRYKLIEKEKNSKTSYCHYIDDFDEFYYRSKGIWVFKLNDLTWKYIEENKQMLPEIIFNDYDFSSCNNKLLNCLKPSEFNSYFFRLEEIKNNLIKNKNLLLDPEFNSYLEKIRSLDDSSLYVEDLCKN